MTDRPTIENAPGLKWRLQPRGWEARWRARYDLVKRGFPVKTVSLWGPSELQPNTDEAKIISDRCHALQNEMLTFAHGGIEPVPSLTDTWGGLIAAYRTDPLSTYKQIRYHTRQTYDYRLNEIVEDHGGFPLAETDARQLHGWHMAWSENGTKKAKGHDMMGQIRTLVSFGLKFLENKDDRKECERLALILSQMKFGRAKRQTEFMTADQAVAIRTTAHGMKLHSIAVSQAFQFDLGLRQKDMIGEWVPIEEPGVSDITHGNDKWLRGARWEEINQALVFTHETSKREKEITVPLRICPMVMEELCIIAGCATPGELTRDMLPASGPIIVSERHGVPWPHYEFRRYWRKAAKKCGVPNSVMNMHSRAGAITEATLSGAPIEHAKAMATHSSITTTEGYSRGDQAKIANVLQMRVAYRNKKGAE